MFGQSFKKSFAGIILISFFIFSFANANDLNKGSLTTINVFLVGTGLVGNTLLKQIEQQSEYVKVNSGLEIRVVGMANSRSMCFNTNGIPLTHLRRALDKAAEKMTIQAFMERMIQLNLPRAVFVDCTSNQNISDAYAAILESGISIVTPNKKANSGSFEYYQKLKEICHRKNVKFYYDANVSEGYLFQHYQQHGIERR